MQRIRTLALILLAAGGLGAAVGAAPAAAACTANAKAGNAKVQLWEGADCSGGPVSVGFGGEDDQPNFERFKNIDARVVDVNNNRSSLAVAPGWCARLFANREYGGDASSFFCGGARPAAFPIRGLNNVASSMRVCPTDARNQCNKVLPVAPTDPVDPGTDETPVDDGTVLDDSTTTGPPAGEAGPIDDGDPGAGDTPPGGELAVFGPLDGLRFDRAGKRCTRGSTAGARALRAWMEETGIAARRRADIYRCVRARGGRRELHSEGRAVDFQARSQDAAEELIALLLADDYALVRRMGVQEIIYDGTVWSSASPSRVLRRYRGRSPHRRSVHVGLNRRGAAMKTSFWADR